MSMMVTTGSRSSRHIHRTAHIGVHSIYGKCPRTCARLECQDVWKRQKLRHCHSACDSVFFVQDGRKDSKVGLHVRSTPLVTIFVEEPGCQGFVTSKPRP